MDYALNPKANFDYEILETLVSGIELSGYEVKAIRNGKASIKGSLIKILGNEAYLIGTNIAPYQSGNVPESYDPQRTRRLLLKRSEINYLLGKSQEKGLTIVPLKIFAKDGLIKLSLGVAKGKKKYDKRETIKSRDTKRNIARILKSE